MNTTDDTYAQTLAIIFASIDEVNEQLAAGNRMEQSTTAPLIVGGEGLDSLAYVSLIAAIEQKIEEHFGRYINISEDSMMSSCANVGELASAIQSRLAANG